MDNDMDFGDLYEDSDNSKHDNLINKVLKLNKFQNLVKPSRTEPSSLISEFNLVKSGPSGALSLTDLVKPLKKCTSSTAIGGSFDKVIKRGAKLPKPLERPQADRIKRAAAYEKTRLHLDDWEAFVTSNRASDNLQFPLKQELKLDIKKNEPLPNKWRLKTPIDLKIEAIHPQMKAAENVEDKFKLTFKELMEKRKEAAKMRAYQSYIEAKARRQNKIKSKKFHRIEKRERIKKALQEFELLQKTNPAEALRKLEEIEKARIEERFSLRHKGTGQWARNKQIRAKYDKESRQELAQQLSISRDLMQKVKNNNSDEEQEENEENNLDVGYKYVNNPWINGIKPDKEVAQFVGNYRKYWLEEGRKNNEEEEGNKIEETTKLKKTTKKSSESSAPVAPVKMLKIADNQTTKTLKNKKSKIKNFALDTNKKSDVKKRISVQSTTKWEVDNIHEIDKIFDKLNDVAEEKAKKLRKVIALTKRKHIAKHATKKPKSDLSLPSQRKMPIIDEAMDETPKNRNNEEREIDLENVKKMMKNIENKYFPKEDIDPNDHLKIEKVQLNTATPNLIEADEEEEEKEENTQKALISEAFEDDDIIEHFNREKQNEIDKNNPKDIDLSLPGWGSWGGGGIKPRKNPRFILKAPKLPRKDENRSRIIINENASNKIKSHQVSEVPFPFKSVRDYEASIRAPIGNTFVTEQAFKKLTRPPVITKMGTIIEPISKELLLNKRGD